MLIKRMFKFVVVVAAWVAFDLILGTTTKNPADVFILASFVVWADDETTQMRVAK